MKLCLHCEHFCNADDLEDAPDISNCGGDKVPFEEVSENGTVQTGKYAGKDLLEVETIILDK